MSTLRVTNIQDTAGGNSLTTAQNYSGTAKAWVNFNGTGVVAIRASFNVSSITDNGTGNYTVTFTTAFADTSYSPTLSSAPDGNNSNANFFVNRYWSGAAWVHVPPTTTTIRIGASELNGALDTAYNNLTVNR